MACVTNKNSKKHREYGLDEDEAPAPDVSAGELFVKELAQKQISKQTSLAEQLNINQDFVSGNPDVLSVSKFPSGELSLTKFTAKSSNLELLEFLQTKGLNKEEINFFLDLKNGREFLKEKYYKLDPVALDKKIDFIFRKIKTSAPANIYGCKTLQGQSKTGRETVDLDSIKFYPANHPINQLSKIEESLFGHLKTKEVSISPSTSSTNNIKKQKKRKNEEKVSYLEEGCSQWDQKVAKKYKVCEKDITTVVKTCTPQTWYTIRNGEAVFLGRDPKSANKCPTTEVKEKPLSGVPFVAPKQTFLIPLNVINSRHITDDEIRMIPKFESYNRGIPSSTLFVKNLASSIVENDLVQLFGNFEKDGGPAIVYKLMGGRMRGQAFLNFPSISLAENALESVNGFEIKGKPLIIQFGKKS